MKRRICLLVLSCVVLTSCGVSSNEATVSKDNVSKDSEVKVDSELKDNQYKSLDKMPSYNDYDTYLLADAIKEDWFNQIGVASEKLIDGYIQSTTLGYDEDTDTNYLIPDKIVFEGIADDGDYYSRYVLPKDIYMQDSSRKILEYVIEYADSVDNYSETLDEMYNFTDEDAQGLHDYYASLFPDDTEKLAELDEEMKTGLSESHWKDLYDFIPLEDSKSSSMKLGFEYYYRLNKDAVDTYHMLQLKADDYDKDRFRLLLVYDDLKVNVEMRYDHVDKDSGEICVLGDLYIPYYVDSAKVEEQLGAPTN